VSQRGRSSHQERAPRSLLHAFAAATCEYTGKTTYASEAHLFHPPRPQTPAIEIHIAAQNPSRLEQADIAPVQTTRTRPRPSGDSSPLFLARASPAERHVTDAASYLTVMPSRPAAQGFHLGASNHTNTNGRQDPVQVQLRIVTEDGIAYEITSMWRSQRHSHKSEANLKFLPSA